MVGLVERVRKNIAPLRVGIDTLPYSEGIERLPQMDDLVSREFTPNYRKFEQLFTTSVPTGEKGRALRDSDDKIMRYSETIPADMDELLKRLSYNSQNPSNVQAGKYIALLIGFREIASMARVEDRHEEKDKLIKILNTIKEKLQIFPFYRDEHAMSGLNAGYGSGSNGYVPPKQLFHLSNPKAA